MSSNPRQNRATKKIMRCKKKWNKMRKNSNNSNLMRRIKKQVNISKRKERMVRKSLLMILVMNRSLVMRTMLGSMDSKSMKKRWNHTKIREIRKRISSFKKKKNKLPKNSKARSTKKRRLMTKEMILSMTNSIILERFRCKIRKKM